MTDAMAGGGRGGVGIRLFTQGGEVVKRNFDQIRDSGKKMWAEVATGNRTANPALRAMSGGVDQLKTGLQGLASRAGIAGRALAAIGPIGVALAAGIGAALLAVTRLREALRWADELKTQADVLGITAEAWQELGYIAGEVDVPIEKLHASILKLNDAVGRYRTGVGDERVKQAFQALGIKPEDLAGIENAADLLPLLAERLGQVQSRADQVALARRLGIVDLLPVLRQGADGIADLSAEARDLGLVVSNETVTALEKADRQIDVAGQRINTSMRLAVAGLADDFANLVKVLADVVVWLNRAFERASQFQALSAEAGGPRHGPLGAAVGFGRLVQLRLRGETPQQIAARARAGAGGGSAAPPPSPELAGFDLTTPPGGGGARATAEAARLAREAEQRLQRQQRHADQLFRLENETLTAMQGTRRAAEEQLAFALDRLAAEMAQRDEAIARQQLEYERSEGLRGISAAEAEQLRALEALLHSAKERNLLDEAAVAAAERRLAAEEQSVLAIVELMGLDAQLADTSHERFRIEREILETSRRIARKRLEQELDLDNNLTEADRVGRLADFDRITGRRLEVLDQNEDQRLRQQFHAYGREFVNAVRGGKLGEFIAERMADRLMSGLLDQLFNALSGSSGSLKGDGGFLSGLFSAGASLFGGGRAGGGDLRRGYRYTTLEHNHPELAVFGADGQMFSHSELAAMLRDMAGVGPGGGGAASAPAMPPPLIFDMRGAVVTAELLDQVNQKVAAGEARVRGEVPNLAVSAVADARARRII